MNAFVVFFERVWDDKNIHHAARQLKNKTTTSTEFNDH